MTAGDPSPDLLDKSIEAVLADGARSRVRLRHGSGAHSKGNCLHCHVIAGEGVAMGPDLTAIGLRRSASFLRRTLLDPKTSIPAGYAFVDIVTTENQRVSGFRLSEDTYTVQVRDLSGRLYSFWKTELSEYRKDATRTPMPSFQTTLSDPEREDLIAYLLSLRGAQ